MPSLVPACRLALARRCRADAAAPARAARARRADGRRDLRSHRAEPAARLAASEAPVRCGAAGSFPRAALGLLPRAASGRRSAARSSSCSRWSTRTTICCAVDRKRMEQVMRERARRAADQLPERIATCRSVDRGSTSDRAERSWPDEPIGVLLDVGTGAGHLLELLGCAGDARSRHRHFERRAAARAHQGARCRAQSLRAAARRHVRPAFRRARCSTPSRPIACWRRAQRPAAALSEIARTLKHGGRARRHRRLRRLSAARRGESDRDAARMVRERAGLECQRVHPVDTESLTCWSRSRGGRSVAACKTRSRHSTTYRRQHDRRTDQGSHRRRREPAARTADGVVRVLSAEGRGDGARRCGSPCSG